MKSRYGLLSTLTAIALFLALETISILLVVEKGVVQRFKVMGAVRSAQSWVWTRTSRIGYYFNYKAENERLTAENLQLRQQLVRYAAARAALDSVAVVVEPDYTFIGASVIKNSVDRQHNHLILNRGREEGIETGMGVVTAHGAIGIVSAVSRHYCYVLSLLGTDQSVSAKLVGSGAFGPMVWTGKQPDQAILREIPVHVTVAPRRHRVLQRVFHHLPTRHPPRDCRRIESEQRLLAGNHRTPDGGFPYAPQRLYRQGQPQRRVGRTV